MDVEKEYNKLYKLNFKTLLKQLDNNQLCHAYLFCMGNSEVNFKQSYKFACDITKNNFSFNDNNFNNISDVSVYYPHGSNGYLNSQIKKIIDTVNLSPIKSDYKVYIINNAEMLTSSSANAFLKTLEEPPDFVVFILLSNNVDNILPTIVSRCQVYKFRNLTFDEIKTIVNNEINVEDNTLKIYLKLFNNNVDKTIEFLNDDDLKQIYDSTVEIVKGSQGSNEWETLKASGHINDLITMYCSKLQMKLKDKLTHDSDVLESQIIKDKEIQNKRYCAQKEKQLLYFVTDIVLYYFNFLQYNKLERWDKNVVDIIKIQSYLEYNISAQNYLDNLFLLAYKINNSKC